MATFGSTPANADFSQTTGTATNDNASAGNIGEEVNVFVNSAGAIAMSTATTANIASITLSAGDWDVGGTLSFKYNTATTTADGQGAISSTTATLPASDALIGWDNSRLAGLTCNKSVQVPTQRFSLSGSTTLFLVARTTFTGTSCGGFGFMHARRVR